MAVTLSAVWTRLGRMSEPRSRREGVPCRARPRHGGGRTLGAPAEPHRSSLLRLDLRHRFCAPRCRHSRIGSRGHEPPYGLRGIRLQNVSREPLNRTRRGPKERVGCFGPTIFRRLTTLGPSAAASLAWIWREKTAAGWPRRWTRRRPGARRARAARAGSGSRCRCRRWTPSGRRPRRPPLFRVQPFLRTIWGSRFPRRLGVALVGPGAGPLLAEAGVVGLSAPLGAGPVVVAAVRGEPLKDTLDLRLPTRRSGRR